MPPFRGFPDTFEETQNSQAWERIRRFLEQEELESVAEERVSGLLSQTCCLLDQTTDKRWKMEMKIDKTEKYAK